MPLFPTTTPEVVIPEPQRILSMMRMQNERSIETRKQVFNINFDNFWSSKEIAQAICDLEWNDAYKWFEMSWKEQLALKELDPTWEFLVPPYQFKINENWTVEILDL